MAMTTPRLLLPTADYSGARSTGTIKTIAPDTFQTVDDRFPVATQEMLVSVDNSLVFIDNNVVYI